MSDKSEEGEPKLPKHWYKVKSSVAEPGRDYYFNVKNKKSVWTLREARLPKNNICKRKPSSNTIPKPPSETPNEDSSENEEKQPAPKGQKQTDQTTQNKPTPPFGYDFGQNFTTMPPGWPAMTQPPVFPYNPNVPPSYPFPQAWNFPQHYPGFPNPRENLITFGNPQSAWPIVNESGSPFNQKPMTQSAISQNVNQRFDIAPTNQIEANHLRQNVQLNQFQAKSGQSKERSALPTDDSVGNENAGRIKLRRSLSTSNLLSDIKDEEGVKINLKDDDLRLKLMAKRQRCVSVNSEEDTDKGKGIILKRRLSLSALKTDDGILENTLELSKSETDSSNEMDEDHSPLAGDSYGFWLLRSAKTQVQPNCVYICIDTNIFMCDLELVTELVERDKEGICRFLVPYVVHHELDCLKKSTFENRPTTRDVNTRRRATMAMRFLNEQFNNPNNSFISDAKLNKQDMVIRRYGNDDEILNCCIRYQNENIHVVLLTADVGLSNKAHEVNIPCYTAHKMKKLLQTVQDQIEKRDLVFKLKVTIPNTTAEKSSTDETPPKKLERQIQTCNIQPAMHYPNVPPIIMQAPPMMVRPTPPVIVHPTPPVILPATFDPTVPPPPFQYMHPYIPNHMFVRPVTSQNGTRSAQGLDSMSTVLNTIDNSEKGGNLETQSMSSDTANSADSFGRAVKLTDMQRSPKTKGKAVDKNQSEPQKVVQRTESNTKVGNTDTGQRIKLIRKPVLSSATREKPDNKNRSRWVRTAPCDSAPKESAPAEKSNNAQKPAFSSNSAQKPAFGSISSQKPTFSSVTTLKPVFSSRTAPCDSVPKEIALAGKSNNAQKPAFSSISTQKPTFGSVSTQLPTFSSNTTQQLTFSSTTTQQPTFSSTTTQQPAISTISSTTNYPSVTTASVVSKSLTATIDSSIDIPESMSEIVEKEPIQQKSSAEVMASDPLNIPLTRVLSGKLTSRMDEWTLWFEQIMDNIITDVLMSDSRPHTPRLLQPPWSFHEALSALAECYQHENKQLSAVASLLARKVNESLRSRSNSDKIPESEKNVKVYYRVLSPKNPEAFIGLYKEARALLTLLKDVHDKAEVEKAENGLILLLEELQQGKLEAKHDELSIQASVDNLVEESDESEDHANFRPKQGIDVRGMIIDYLKRHYPEWSQYQEKETEQAPHHPEWSQYQEKETEPKGAPAEKPERNLGVKFTVLPEFEAKLKSGECGLEDEFAEDEEEWEDGEEDGLDVDYAEDELYEEVEDGMEVAEVANDRAEETVDGENGESEDMVIDEDAPAEDANVGGNGEVEDVVEDSMEGDKCGAVNLAISQCILNVKLFSVKMMDIAVPAIYSNGDTSNLPPLPGILSAFKQLITCLENVNHEIRCDGNVLLSCIRLLAPSFKNLPKTTQEVVAGAVRLRELVPDAFADSLISMNQTFDLLQTYYQNMSRLRARRIAKKVK